MSKIKKNWELVVKLINEGKKNSEICNEIGIHHTSLRPYMRKNSVDKELMEKLNLNGKVKNESN